MRLLLIGMGHQRDEPGGANRYMTFLAEGLVQRGHEVHLLVGDRRGDLPPDETIAGVRVHRFAATGHWLTAVRQGHRAARQLASAERFDLVNSHFALMAAGPRLVGDLARLPWVSTFHGPWATESLVEKPEAGPLEIAAKRQLEGWIYRASHQAYALSQAFAAILASDYRMPRSRIAVIPGMIDTDRFGPTPDKLACRRRLNLPEPGPLWISVRRLQRRMGLDRLLRAFDHLVSEGFKGRLALVGDGDCRSELEAEAGRLAAADRISFAGAVSEEVLLDYYGAADLQIVPTVAFEGFGMIVLESLARGTPVLATPVGGLVEVLSPLASSCLSADASDAALLEAMIEVARGDRRLPPPDECRRYVVERHGVASVVERVEAVFGRALDPKTPGGKRAFGQVHEPARSREAHDVRH